MVKLREVVTYRKQFIEIDDQETYKRCRVQLHRRGVKLRDIILGSNIKTKKQRLCKSDDFIVAEMDAKFGGYGIIPEELHGAIVSSHYYLYELDQSKLLPAFLTVIIDSGVFDEQIKAVGSTNYSRISAKEILEYEIPCPSLDDQRSIIDFYFNSKEKCSDLGTEFVYQQTLLKKLRQQILQEAIEGKLTEEFRMRNEEQLRIWNYELRQATDPETIRHLKLKIRNCSESAASLLSRVKAEKEQLIKDKKIKNQKNLPPITEEEKPFDLPDGWVWCRLGHVVNAYEAGKSFKCIDRQVSNDEWGVLKTSAVTSSYYREKEHKFYQSKMPSDVSKKVNNGDLIFCRASGSKGLAGKCCLVKGVCNNLLLSDKTPRLQFSDLMEKMYVFFHNETEHTKTYYSGLNTGKSTSMNNITKDQLFEKPLPLPPAKEQKAIITKVEKLLAICDQLEVQITSNQTHAEQLMQAVLKEAFQHAEKCLC